jgi:hypothetical protein
MHSTMPADFPPQDKENKPQRRPNNTSNTFFAQHTAPALSACDSGVCSMNYGVTSTTLTTTPTSSGYLSIEPEHEVESNATLNDLLPPDLYEAMYSAAKQGILLSFLSTITDEWLSNYLMAQHYETRHIVLVNQTIKALSLVAMGIYMGNSAAKSAVAPALNFCLSFIMQPNHATLLTTSFITCNNLINATDLAPTMIKTGASLLAGYTSLFASQQIKEKMLYPVANYIRGYQKG